MASSDAEFPSFRADANGDGRIAFDDLPAWLAQLFFLPGDWAVWAIVKYAPPLASVLGIGSDSYGGFVSGFLAALSWLIVLVLLGAVYSYVVDFDRRATRASRQAYGSLLRIWRAATRSLRARLAARRRRAEDRAAGVTGDVRLDAVELRVLRELAELGPGYVSAARELARALRLRVDEVQTPLDGLARRRLVVRTLGGGDGDSGYALSAAGRSALLVRQLASRSAEAPDVDAAGRPP